MVHLEGWGSSYVLVLGVDEKEEFRAWCAGSTRRMMAYRRSQAGFAVCWPSCTTSAAIEIMYEQHHLRAGEVRCLVPSNPLGADHNARFFSAQTGGDQLHYESDASLHHIFRSYESALQRL